jgi:hypothetical protein
MSSASLFWHLCLPSLPPYQGLYANKLQGWQYCIFRLAPLIDPDTLHSDPSVQLAAADLLLDLAEQSLLRSVICAAGGCGGGE